jgi:hypothetical protein
MRSAGPTASPPDSVNTKGVDDADPAAAHVAGLVGLVHPPVDVAVITIVYVPGTTSADRSQVGFTLPSVALGRVQAGPVEPLTVMDTDVGCGPVDGYGSAVNVGPANADAMKKNGRNRFMVDPLWAISYVLSLSL